MEKTKQIAKVLNDLITSRSFCSNDQSLLESFIEEYFFCEDNFDEHDSSDAIRMNYLNHGVSDEYQDFMAIPIDYQPLPTYAM